MYSNLKQSFLTPPSEFSPIPFWFWNDTLSAAEITRQIEDFYEKGIMGFVIHPRKGLPREIPYLSDIFMHYVKHAVKEAARLGMHVVLYDEAMYPSGSAHGMVVKDHPEYATRALRLAEFTVPGNESADAISSALKNFASAQISDDESLLTVIAACKNETGAILHHTLREADIYSNDILQFINDAQDQLSIYLLIEGYSNGTIRGIHLGEDDGEPDVPPSADLLNPDAMDRFIHLTHDRYYEVLKEYFGSTVIAMFTDEPDVLGRCHRKDCQPWTIGFADFCRKGGIKLTDLPLLWQTADDGSHQTVRLQYQKAVNKRLSETYYQKLSNWCVTHNIALTGHPAQSDDIGLLQYFQIPGQDLVWRWVAPENGKGLIGTHSTMGKCSSDAARHTGKRRNSNECFGCCGPDGVQWAFTADDMKWYLDWLFVRGVNLLYPHAFFYSIKGEERFGERPPDVGPNNTFWSYYNLFSDYIKRICWLMTDSHNTTPIAVLCSENHLPWEPAKELFCNQLEFNYLEDTLLLTDCCRHEDGWLKIQNQAYRIIITDSDAMQSDAVSSILQAFTAAGGHVICRDQIPDLIATLKSIMANDPQCPGQPELVSNLPCTDIRISHVVKGGCDFYFVTNEGEVPFTCSLLLPCKASDHTVRLEKWDAWRGTQESLPVAVHQEKLPVHLQLERRESIIFCVCCHTTVNDSCHSKEADLSCGDWKITAPGCQSVITKLTDWTTWSGMKEYSGSVIYETTFVYQRSPEKQVILDLGEVHEIASLVVNSREMGVKLWAPYRFDITSALQDGTNTLKLTITNTPANRLEKAALPSGLLGPVQLVSIVR